MTTKAKQQLKSIKSEDFSSWTASFWIVKKKASSVDAAYSVLRVSMDVKLKGRFKRYLKQQLQSREFHLAKYDYNNVDGDDALFTIDADATDFGKVASAIGSGFKVPLVTRYEELLNSWAYVILFENNGKKLYAWRKINAETQPKKVASKDLAFFLNRKLVDVDDKEVFMIHSRYDFFVYDGTTFIANKRNFESSMNFREGMKANGEAVLSAFEKLNIFEGIGLIREFVGTNLHHLRKLSSIRKAGYFNQPDYMAKLISVNKKEKWDLKIKNGKIVIEAETVELLLKLLNNDRLRSPINDELFDSAAKALVPKKIYGN